MIKVLLERFKQGYKTIPFPREEPTLPDLFRGLPVLNAAKCVTGCRACVEACPTLAISVTTDLSLDMGRCLFCAECADVCPNGAITFSRGYKLAARNRHDLIVTSQKTSPMALLDEKAHKLFGRSLRLRQVSAGGCNACEADTNVLGTVVFDLGRFGIQFVASPRHADGLLITGPVPENMKLALEKTYKAVPSPKIVIAAGACGVSGGPYVDHAEVHNGADSIVPVDLYLPGCPPHPTTILHGLLALLGRID